MKLARASQPWYIIATPPNEEEKVAVKLTRAGYHVYLPRYRMGIVNSRTRTWREAHLPLLPRYMFIDMTKLEFEKVRERGGVQFVRGMDGPKRINGKAVEQLQTMEIEGRFDCRLSRVRAAQARKEYVKGDPVKIQVGRWAEFQAVVKEVTDRAKVKVSFQIFGRDMDVEIESEHLTPA